MSWSLVAVLALNTHRVGKVQDNKGTVGHARLAEEGVGLAGQVLVVQLLHPALIRTFGHLMMAETWVGPLLAVLRTFSG